MMLLNRSVDTYKLFGLCW